MQYGFVYHTQPCNMEISYDIKRADIRSMFLTCLLFFTLMWISLPEQETETTKPPFYFVPEVHTLTVWNASTILRNNYNYTCSQTFQQLKISDLHICGEIHNIEYKMIFFTTMYYSASSAQFFRNTLHVIASMKRDHNVQPVLFVESPRSFVDNYATNFIQSACDLGWVVLLVQHCNHHAFPVFKSMFNVTMTTWSNAQWYGYSNADMLFDDSLIKTVDFIQSRVGVLKIPMIMGRRYNLAIQPTRHIDHYKQLRRLYVTSKIDFAQCVDYFVVRKGAFPWHKVPDFVIGRPAFDTWMVWFSQHAKLPIVDTTATVRAIHQNQIGLSRVENTHRVRRIGESMDYNRNLAKELEKKDKSMHLVLPKGFLSCLSLKLIKMKRSKLNSMVSLGQTEIVGRGRSHYPVPANDEELRHAIQNLNFTFSNDSGNGNTSLTSGDDYVIKTSSATKRKLLMVKEEAKTKVKTPEAKPKTKEKPQAKPHAAKTKAAEPKAAEPKSAEPKRAEPKAAEPKTAKPKGAEPKAAVPKSAKPKAKPKEKPKPKQTGKPAKSVKTKQAKNPTFEYPQMIPYIGDTNEYVFVIVRRTFYLERNQKNNGFIKLNFKTNCHRHQNIDMELSEFVTF